MRPARPPAAPGRPGRGRALRHDRQAELHPLPALPRAVRPRPARRVLLPRGLVRRDPAGVRRPHGRMLSLAGIDDRRRARAESWRWRPRLASAHWDRVAQPGRRRDVHAARPGQACRSSLPASTGTRGSRASRPRRRCSTRSSCASRTSSRRLARPSTPSRSGTGGSGWPGASSAAARRTSVTTLADESFAFYGRTLTGAPEQKERWKRGIDIGGVAPSARRWASCTSSGTSRRRPRSG